MIDSGSLSRFSTASDSPRQVPGKCGYRRTGFDTRSVGQMSGNLTRVDFAKLERLCTEGALHAVGVGCRLSVGPEGQNGDSD
jgi:hypothetical protein